MESHPLNQPACAAAAPSAAAQVHRLPLATRAIGGFLVLWGTMTLLDILLQALFGRGANLDFGLFALPIGWGLLRRRNWARIWAVVISLIITGVCCFLTVMAWIGSADRIRIRPDPGDIGDFPRRLLFCGIMIIVAWLGIAAWRHLVSDPVLEIFEDRSPRQPFVVWNPRKWRFRIGTLLYLTVLVAFVAIRLAEVPMVQQLVHWQAFGAQPLPNYLEELPPLPTGNGFLFGSTKLPDGRRSMLEYGYHYSRMSGGAPALDYAVFQVSDGSLTGMVSTKVSTRDPVVAALRFDGRTFHFPGANQLVAEVSDGQTKTSNMRITFPEFWHFLHSNDPRTLNSLERHVRELRERVDQWPDGPRSP